MSSIYTPDPDKRRHYLWHLEQIGLMTGDTRRPVEAWRSIIGDGADGNTVAIIDNGMAADHPNLNGDRIRVAVDFSYNERGAFYDADKAPDPAEDTRDISSLGAGLSAAAQVRLARHVASAAELLDRSHLPDPAHRFGNHGTAIAGLVAGAPPAGGGSANDLTQNAQLNYYGVDPTARILSIATLYDHSIWPVIQALILAYRQGADVIVIPRAITEPQTIAPQTVDGIDDLRMTRITTPGTPEHTALVTDREIFETLLGEISAQVPVVVAAGNSGRDRLSYPARLVETVAPDLFVAAAANANGVRSSYSCYSDSARYYHAPSNDGQLVDVDHMRFDPDGWDARNIFPGQTSDWSPFGVLTTDIPGDYGYTAGRSSGGGADDPTGAPEGHGSFYTMFGGTSAASAITAGFLSLLLRRSGGTASVEDLHEALALHATEASVEGAVPVISLG